MALSIGLSRMVTVLIATAIMGAACSRGPEVQEPSVEDRAYVAALCQSLSALSTDLAVAAPAIAAARSDLEGANIVRAQLEKFALVVAAITPPADAREGHVRYVRDVRVEMDRAQADRLAGMDLLVPAMPSNVAARLDRALGAETVCSGTTLGFGPS